MNDEDQYQRIQELFLLQRVAQRINAILDLDTLLEEVVNDVAQTFGYSRSAVLLKDDHTDELVIAAVRGWTINFHIKGERFKIGEYGMVGHVGATGETHYAPDVSVDPYYQVSEASTRSELDIPLKVRGRLIGVFNFQHHELNGFSTSRIQLLEALAGHIATAIENARLFQRERQEKERMARELEEARRVQLSLFPGRNPDLPSFEITGLCLPCSEVGGDWYDYIPLRDGRLALVLADVSGKGMAAALLMASTRSILRLFAERDLPPAEVLTQVNRVLIEDFPRAKFVTMIYAVVDPALRNIVFANAGHLPPLFVNATGSQFLKIDSGLPLGIQDVSFSEYRLAMPPESRLLFYSDGVSEAMNAAMEEFGARRIRDHMANPSASVQSLLDGVRAFAKDYPASDDRTLVLISGRA
ncbi:GAF domain-containing protein [candidate division KSB1 bacterium]|nr:MAG: GAF domain-containing protein [candidate division KSB1 bacterium]MBC6947100.1 GAF domain-containing protein [candidate division KSB1 bacterium]MCE7941522.1 GAF domain-containing protein [Chlorobi bacterium CHB1]MDL1876906.1 GAF domain-containing protein [Cytophagia bacterium CHB2]